MLRNSTIKPKPCKECGSLWHSAMHHKPRKPILTKKQLLRSKKRIRPESKKTREKRLKTTKDWFAANPPDADGYWYCYIPKHSLCPGRLTRETIVLEHDLSKARRKDLQFDITNIHPACTFDNEAKGSLSAKEYMEK